MNFVHLSDLHIRVSPMEPLSSFPSEKMVDDGTKLRAVLRRVKNQLRTPDFILFTGDLVFEGDADDYRLLRSILDEELGAIPRFFALGNHDRHGAFWEGFMGEADRENPYYYTETINGLRMIALDSSPKDGCVVGEFSEEQLAFLRDTLKEPAPKGSFLMLHHPLNCAFAEFAPYLVKNADALIRVIQGSDVRGPVCGATHFTGFHGMGGILSVTASSTCFGVDLTGKVVKFTESSSYVTGRVTDDLVLVSQVDMELGAKTVHEIDPNVYNNLMAQQAALKN
jgi:3',5'-cyclic AMP phosphodiesterase CpdA